MLLVCWWCAGGLLAVCWRFAGGLLAVCWRFVGFVLLAVCWRLQTVPENIRCHIHHHCVLVCTCQRISRSAFPFSDIQLPGSQAWFKTFRVVAPDFHKHHDLLHQRVLSILRIWRRSAVCQMLCLCSVGILNRSDKSSDTAVRFQAQRSSTSVCNTSGVHRPALPLLPGRSDSVPLRTCPSTFERPH